MDTLRSILTRRSIRRFQPREIPVPVVHDILAAAMSAPSAGNEQPWHFVLMTEKALLEEIPAIHPHAAMAAEAPLAVLICADMNLAQHEGFWIQDCAAAAENLLIAAHGKGLGGVWTGIHPREERVRGMRELLSLPAHIVPVSLIPLGYPAEELPAVNRFHEKRVHHNGW